MILLPALFAHASASDPFNLTSFSVISDPSGFETIEANLDAGGGTTFDRVIANEHGIYVRMRVRGGNVYGLAIMNANDVLQTKYIATSTNGIAFDERSIGDTVRIIIKNVTKHMGIRWYDYVLMNSDPTTIIINNDSESDIRGTWTSTICPNNVTVELNCVVVEVNKDTSVVTAKCDSETTWSESVFNRIPIWISGSSAYFGYDSTTNYVLFGTSSFPSEGSALLSGWEQYNVTGYVSNLTIGDQVTIKNLQTSFVSHCVNIIHAKAYMGGGFAMLVPPESFQ